MAGLLVAWYIEKTLHKDIETDDTLVFILTAVHSLSYAAGLFRTYDISINGKADNHGVPRAPRESTMKSIEILTQCIVFGHVLTKQYMMTSEKFHKNAYTHYFI